MLSDLSSSLIPSDSIANMANWPNPPCPAQSVLKKADISHPSPPRTSITHHVSTSPSGAMALEEGLVPNLQNDESSPPDAFESRKSEEVPEPPRASVDLDELPIELITLTDGFIDFLSAKVHPTPLNADQISSLFQDFYATAATHIQTHVDSLATRQKRTSSPAPSTSSRATATSILRAKAVSFGKDKPRGARKESDTQMMTAEEFAARKRARKLLEQKRSLMEEAVERRLCQGIYSKIYRHRSTSDEAQDDKLRSKTAALAVVGIGPVDLGVDLGVSEPDAAAKKQEEIKDWLEPARKELVLMSESEYPLGKLNRLKAAHKSIIDTLSHFHPSSSADEVMPMLIYSLITLPPQNLHAISDVHFIQRFRWEPKLMGEAAYCLTNLEATISFLETVDLSTLRADEHPSGPQKVANLSKPGTPKAETFPPAYMAPGTPAVKVTSEPGCDTFTPDAAARGEQAKAESPSGIRAAVQLRNRRLSDLVNTPAQAFNAASDAVITTADQGIKTISTSLGDSYRFFLGKFRETPDGQREVIVPKTLEDARKLINTPPLNEDDGPGSDDSLVHGAEAPDRSRKLGSREDKILSLIGGRKVSREHSADSGLGASSSKKATIAADENVKDRTNGPAAASASANPALINSMRNLGSSLNPMSRLSGIGGFRGFGRTATAPIAPTVKDQSLAESSDLATAFPDIAPSLPPKEIRKVNPPIKRFMEMQNPADLKIGEVLELLRDYRRLAGVLNDSGAFKD